MTNFLLSRQLSVAELVVILLGPYMVSSGHSVILAFLVLFAITLTHTYQHSNNLLFSQSFSPIQCIAIAVGQKTFHEFPVTSVFLVFASYVATYLHRKST